MAGKAPARPWRATVGAGESGARLDQWLAARLPELSRSRVKALIEAGHVLVGGRAVKAAQRLRPGQQVRASIPAPSIEQLAAETIPLRIVFEDEQVLVVDKPAGMVTHPGAGHLTGTLAAAALAHAPQMAGVGSPRRPGIVHRLDKGTSGLIVLAKTQQAYDSLTAQLAQRSMTRLYLGLVQGALRRPEGILDAPIGRDPHSRVRMAVTAEGRGKRAVTRFRVLEGFRVGASAITFLECRLETGRTHQIRVHLASIGHPLLGDETYGGRRSPRVADPTLAGLIGELGGVALHAVGLAFAHPVTGARLEFTCPLPDRINRILSHLRTPPR